jgi:predicted lactoylglutathione lyase
MNIAVPFYDKLLPLLGFDVQSRAIAFKATSRAEIDRLHSDLKKIGATIVSPPREYAEYTPPGYYALFFKDLEGIKYEIVCTEHSAPW